MLRQEILLTTSNLRIPLEWLKNSFDNDTARNVIIFGVDNSSSSHIDNQ